MIKKNYAGFIWICSIPYMESETHTKNMVLMVFLFRIGLKCRAVLVPHSDIPPQTKIPRQGLEIDIKPSIPLFFSLKKLAGEVVIHENT